MGGREMKPKAVITIPDVVERFANYYEKPGNGAWGRLHVVLDDGNVDNKHVEFCVGSALEIDDKDGAELARTLLQMSRGQRLRLPNAVHAFIKQRKAAQHV